MTVQIVYRDATGVEDTSGAWYLLDAEELGAMLTTLLKRGAIEAEARDGDRVLIIVAKSDVPRGTVSHTGVDLPH